MKRNIYILLCVITLVLLGYTAYYAISHKGDSQVASETLNPVATTTPEAQDKNTYITKSGKKIKLVETNPAGESLSTITITPEGFTVNMPIVLEVNKLTNSFYFDLNNDNYEELIITTMAQGSGSFGDIFIYTTASNTELLPVAVPEITEDDTKKGSLFEGYMGHDSFTIVDGKLTREFPTYNKTDTSSEPTGPRKNIIYSLVEKKGLYSMTLSKGMVINTTSTTTVPLPGMAPAPLKSTSTGGSPVTPASIVMPNSPSTGTSSMPKPPTPRSGSGATSSNTPPMMMSPVPPMNP